MVEGYHRGGGVPQRWRGTIEVEGYHRGGGVPQRWRGT